MLRWLALPPLLVAACGGGGKEVAPADARPGAPTSELDASANASPDGASTDASPGPVVVISTTMGDLVVQLDPAHMPITTANFLGYVDAGFYDGTLIHRVVDDWVIQGGGYTSGLVAKPPGPPIPLETSPSVSHIHGAISMARTSDPDSATSQWFIVDWPTTGTPLQPAQLDGHYAAFGVLIEGFDVLEAITQVPTTSQGVLDDVPVTEITVTSARRR
jgi:cyclophilin family peptidyl-prolyl cis-trans isomerase